MIAPVKILIVLPNVLKKNDMHLSIKCFIKICLIMPTQNHPTLYSRWLVTSDCVEELDLEDNLIGDLGGKEILEALQERDEGIFV